MTIDHYPYKRCSTLETMNLSHLISRDNWTFQSQERRCHVTTLNLGPSFFVEKIKCLDPRAKVLDQTSHRGDGLRRQIPTPCPHSTPPPHGVYIDRCISQSQQFNSPSCFAQDCCCCCRCLGFIHGRQTQKLYIFEIASS